jgi:tetratricopeptide (TPR) repeat protein
MIENSGNRPEALQNYRKAVVIQEAIANADPTNTVARGDLSEDYMKTSDISLKLGARAEALKGYRKALAIREELVAKNPDNAEGRVQLARIYESLGEYFSLAGKSDKRVNDWQEAQRQYQQSVDVWVDLKSKGKLSADYARKPEEVSRKLAACNTALAGMSATGSNPKGK